MKKFVLFIIALSFIAAVLPVSASELQYDCSVTGKPDKPKYLWYRYPTPKHKDRDAVLEQEFETHCRTVVQQTEVIHKEEAPQQTARLAWASGGALILSTLLKRHLL